MSSSFEVEHLEIPEVLLITPRVFHDERGSFKEVFREKEYREIGINEKFVQSNVSYSKSGVVRGMHYQLKSPQAKLFTVISGEVYDVAVDIRIGSPTFGKSVGHRLNGEQGHQLYIPAGFAHGFSVLSAHASIHYMCSDYYAPEDERGIRWDDPTLQIQWPNMDLMASEKDSMLPVLSKVEAYNLPGY